MKKIRRMIKTRRKTPKEGGNDLFYFMRLVYDLKLGMIGWLDIPYNISNDRKRVRMK